MRRKQVKKPRRGCCGTIVGVFVIMCVIAGIGSCANGGKEDTKEVASTESTIVESSEASTSATTEAKSYDEVRQNLVRLSSEELAEAPVWETKEVVLNEGTEFEETRTLYAIPAGYYQVFNMSEYPAQVNFTTTNTQISEDGWEEWTDEDVIMLAASGSEFNGATDTAYIKVSEGEYVYIAAPYDIGFVSLNETQASVYDIVDIGNSD